MLVIGARGHAIEILQILEDSGFGEGVCFYDNVNPDAPRMLFGRYPILRTNEEVVSCLELDSRVVIGIGGTTLRDNVARQLVALGGELTSAISPFAHLGRHQVQLGRGLNIMDGVIISNEVAIGEGSLINARVSLHHNVTVGRYCQISPGAQLLGRVQVGDCCHIGASATVLPDICIGAHASIGAGAVVTRDVAPYSVVVGVPARPHLRRA